MSLLVGERQPGETGKAIAACNDYVRMGPGRSLAKLRQSYIKATLENPPTRHLRTLGEWSRRYGWQARAAAYDTEAERQKTAEAAAYRREIIEQGFALDMERVRELKRLADLLGSEVHEEDKRWLPDVKQIGGGKFAERVDIVRFNASLIEQFRGALDDIAKEVGGRIQKSDITSGGQPVTYIVENRPQDD